MRITTILLALPLAACGGKSKDNTQPMPHNMGMGGDDMSMSNMKMGMAAPSADSQAVLDRTKGYASWPAFAENATPKFSKAHMGMWVVTYHNDVVKTAIDPTARSSR